MFITSFSIVSRRKIKEVNSVLALTLYFFLTPDLLTDQNQVHYCELVAVTAGHLSTNYRRRQLHSPSLTVVAAGPEHLGNEDQTVSE